MVSVKSQVKSEIIRANLNATDEVWTQTLNTVFKL